MAEVKSYKLTVLEIESLIDELGFEWEDKFNDYEEYLETIEETLKGNKN